MTYDRAYLQRRLLERNARPELARAIDEELWSLLGVELAILVSDMAGFTRLAKKRGITHFLSMHYQGVELARPLIPAHDGTLLKTEADNMIATFATPVDAARCALAMQNAAGEYNGRTADPEARINFCLGLGYGRVLGLTDDAFGDEVNTAYKLGEDIATAGEILASRSIHGALAASAEFRFGAESQARTGNVDLAFHRLFVAKP